MGEPFRVLVVDDNAELAANLKDILEVEEYTVTVSHDGGTTLNLCREKPFDLALIDVKLPDISGPELIEKLDTLCPKMEYIIITGNATLDSAVRAVGRKKIIAYESKPLDMHRLLDLIRQVSEKREAEAALLKSEVQYRRTVETANEGIWIADSNARAIFVNQKMADMLGYSPKEIIGRTVFDFMAANERETAMQNRQKLIRGMRVQDERLFRRKDGTLLWTLANSTPQFDENGRYTGTLAMHTDITARKQAEEELKKANETLEKTVSELNEEVEMRRDAEERLRDLSLKLIEAQEKERRAIGRELHDQTGQYLTALKLLLGKVLHNAGENADPLLGEAYSITDEMMKQVRELSLSLRPPMLDDLGLLSAFLWHIDRYQAQTGIRVEFKHTGLDKGLDKAFPPEVATAAYRIVQEALTNVAKYAGVKEVCIITSASKNRLLLRVEDKGRGFNVSATDTRASGGLSGMMERAMLLGGKLTIDSNPGDGTTVAAELPVNGKPKISGGEKTSGKNGKKPGN